MYPRVCSLLTILAIAAPASACSDCVDAAIYGYVPFARWIPFIFLGWYLLFGAIYVVVQRDLSRHSPARPHKGFFWHCLLAMAIAVVCGIYFSFHLPVVVLSGIWLFRLFQGTRAFYHHSKHGFWQERILGGVDAAALACVVGVVIWCYATAFSIPNMVEMLHRNHRIVISWNVIERLAGAGADAAPPMIRKLDALMDEGDFDAAPLFVEALARNGSPAATDYFPTLIARYLRTNVEPVAPIADLSFIAASYVRCAGKAALPELQKAYDRLSWERAREKTVLLDAMIWTGDRDAVLFVLERMDIWLSHGGNTHPLDALVYERDPAILSKLPMPELRLTLHDGVYPDSSGLPQAYAALVGRIPADEALRLEEWNGKKDVIRQRWEIAFSGRPDQSPTSEISPQ